MRIRGRNFTQNEIDFIRRCVQKHSNKGRTYISKRICEELNWKQPNGWLKDRACRDVLLKLERDGIITLPPSRTTRITELKHESSRNSSNSLEKLDLDTPIYDFPDQITLEFAKSNKAERVWNAIIDEFHYLGHTVLVGKSIKYLLKWQDRVLGAIAFSSPAWRIAPRDDLLVTIGFDKSEIHDLVVNNSRFLLLPNVRVPHLASHLLSQATKQVVQDWSEYYSITPLVAETFVQPSLYRGTCYKASNWLGIGITKGYAKRGSNYHNSQEPKLIYLYGLNRRIRRELWKATKTDRER